MAKNNSDLADLSLGELIDELKATKQEALNLRLQQATGQLENSARIRQVRRETAQVITAAATKSA